MALEKAGSADAMPWKDFLNLYDDDVKVIYKYLLSIKPVGNIVPELKELEDL